MSKLKEQVLEFHKAFNMPIQKSPCPTAIFRTRRCLRLIAEEMLELLEACGARPKTCVNCKLYSVIRKLYSSIDEICDYSLEIDLPRVAKKLADLDCVIEGFRLELGIDGDPIAALVHQSNMDKVGQRSYVNEYSKIIQTPSWEHPKIREELKRQGWKEDTDG